MPVHLSTETNEEITLDDLVAMLRASRVDTSDQDSLITAAPWLRQLANNKQFLANMALEELKRGYSGGASIYHYSAQVMLLHLPDTQSDNFLIRANFWPSENDQAVKAAGTGPFFYHRPHDHNFNFLTVGYHGPGYGSRYFEYDHDEVSGYPGELVPSLKFIEEKKLNEGHVMLYRASVDVHDQLPAEQFSISINILENTARARLINQYAFDLEKAVIQRIINISPAPCIFGVIANLGGENGADLLHEIIRCSPDPLMRFASYKALAGTESDKDAYCETLEHALSDHHTLVSKWAERHIALVLTDDG